jgi:hypothetical protein
MAIVQASLAEEILTRQERAVIRGIYRASQLAEARKSLDQVIITDERYVSNNPIGSTVHKPSMHDLEIREYLDNAIVAALASIKIPASSGKKEIPSQPAAKQ